MALTRAVSDNKAICKPKACPSCGGMGCFERPRYFCGQLLTDKDLDAAQRYVIEKNRLHNRYLFGTGVVCGLAVRCVPCDECAVTIEPGYAIDCCGNDIVLCEPAPFNVCEYIEKCLREKEPSCEGKIRPLSSRCGELPKEYCLIVSYSEEPARPITAMVRSNGCSVSRCEPSRTREIFRFDLIEKRDDKDSESHDDFWSKARECMTEFLKQSQRFFDELTKATKIPDAQVAHTALLSLLCRMEDDILKFYKKGPNVRCTLEEELRKIEDSFPATINDPQYGAKVYNALFRMYGHLLQFTIDCICDALLVPCAECGDEEGVLLACLTVRGGKIEKICNIVRKQVLTGPALRYWLQPLYAGINRLLEYICCELELADVFDRIFRINALRTDLFTGRTNEGFTADAVRTTFIRGESSFKMAENYSTAALRSLRTANLLQFTNPDILTAMDVYNMPLKDAMEKLAKMGFSSVSVRRADTNTEAYALGNLQQMTWVVPPQSPVELVTSPDNLVTAIRVIKEEE